MQEGCSVITSLTNFWVVAFGLANECLKEIERLCAVFFWSGPKLEGRNAKISWHVVCRVKNEGVLGIKPLKESNLVCCLKLIWRILSSAKSLWVNWIKVYLIRKGSLWTTKNTQHGSWFGGSFWSIVTLQRAFIELR